MDVDLPARGGLLDYFMTESFSQLPEERRRRMAELSLLPEIPLSVAETILGPSIAAELAELHRQNFFLSERKTAAGPCYRFHDLYRVFLREQVPRLLDDVGSFEHRAAQAFLVAGDGLSAVELLLESGDFERRSGANRGVRVQPRAVGADREGEGLDRSAAGATARSTPSCCACWPLPRASLPTGEPLESTALESARRLELTGVVPDSSPAWSVLLESKWLEWTSFSDVDEWLGAVDEFRGVAASCRRH